MNNQDRQILELVVKNAVLEAFQEHTEEVITPLQKRLTHVENDIVFARRTAKGVWAIIILGLSYIGIK